MPTNTPLLCGCSLPDIHGQAALVPKPYPPVPCRNEELSCFSITPSAQTRVSITSTSFCCLSILDNQEAWQGLAGYDVSNRINLKEVGAPAMNHSRQKHVHLKRLDNAFPGNAFRLLGRSTFVRWRRMDTLIQFHTSFSSHAPQVRDALMQAPWSFDPFQVC